MKALLMMPLKTCMGSAHQLALVGTLLCVALVGCSREDKGAAGTAVAAKSDGSGKTTEPDHPENAATGSFTVTGATPAAGNGLVTVTRRHSLAVPGQPTILTIEGNASETKHWLLVFVDEAGGVIGMTHQWHQGDEATGIVTECKPCPPAQVTANAKTGEVALRGLLLPEGIDKATGQSGMRSTLTGHVLP
jgi:hypothetical protein